MDELGPTPERRISPALLYNGYQIAYFVALDILGPRLVLVEEAAEEAMAKLEKKVTSKKVPQNPLPWVRVVARNEARKLAKSPRAWNISLEALSVEPTVPKKEESRFVVWRDHFRDHLPLH